MTVNSLDAGTPGRWLVITRGSRHIWDIQPGRVLYQRLAGDTSAAFTADGIVVELTRIDRWPAVGHTSLIWFDDPDTPELIEQWRQSSTISSITRLPETDQAEETR